MSVEAYKRLQSELLPMSTCPNKGPHLSFSSPLSDLLFDTSNALPLVDFNQKHMGDVLAPTKSLLHPPHPRPTTIDFHYRNYHRHPPVLKAGWTLRLPGVVDSDPHIRRTRHLTFSNRTNNLEYPRVAHDSRNMHLGTMVIIAV